MKSPYSYLISFVDDTFKMGKEDGEILILDIHNVPNKAAHHCWYTIDFKNIRPMVKELLKL